MCNGGTIGTIDDLKQVTINLLFALKSLNLLIAEELGPAVVAQVEQTIHMVAGPFAWGLSQFKTWFSGTVMEVIFPAAVTGNSHQYSYGAASRVTSPVLSGVPTSQWGGAPMASSQWGGQWGGESHGSSFSPQQGRGASFPPLP